MQDVRPRFVPWRPSTVAAAVLGVSFTGCALDRVAGPSSAPDVEPASAVQEPVLQAFATTRGPVDPVSRVLRHADALALSPEQVRELEAIRARFATERRSRLQALRDNAVSREPRAARPGNRSPAELEALRARFGAAARERRAALAEGEALVGRRGALRARTGAWAPFDPEAVRERREALRARLGAERQLDRERPGDRLQAAERIDGSRRATSFLRGPRRFGAPAAHAVMEEVRAVLTDEQAAALRTLLAERSTSASLPRRGDAGAGRRGGGGDG